MRIISEILNTKGHEVFSIAPDATVYDAIHLMAEKVIGALLVIDGRRVLRLVLIISAMSREMENVIGFL